VPGSASFGGAPEEASGPEPGSALGPSPGKDLPPRSGPHPEAEPVGLLPSSGVGLIGTFHGVSGEAADYRQAGGASPKMASRGSSRDPSPVRLGGPARRLHPQVRSPFASPRGSVPWSGAPLTRRSCGTHCQARGRGVVSAPVFPGVAKRRPRFPSPGESTPVESTCGKGLAGHRHRPD
jgi:hypothetical protein